MFYKIQVVDVIKMQLVSVILGVYVQCPGYTKARFDQTIRLLNCQARVVFDLIVAEFRTIMEKSLLQAEVAAFQNCTSNSFIDSAAGCLGGAVSEFFVIAITFIKHNGKLAHDIFIAEQFQTLLIHLVEKAAAKMDRRPHDLQFVFLRLISNLT
ncbi:hypothetical protein AO064_01980 [Pseudomonas marginalis]|uniref:Uncharacterized protein n=1 Tax=Pseudomonas marginalis TaxID=298 RepID=A0A9X5KWJ4_PSEMA|nr:hypothetical protein AO064_01980 [Pseudomonas marginalis]